MLSPSRHRLCIRVALVALLVAVLVVPLLTANHPAGAGSTTLTAEEQSQARDEMNPAKAIVLGAVEGITEFLPISSTGHLVVTQRLLGIGDTSATKDAADDYAIAIQFGAILAVLFLYQRRIRSIIMGAIGRDAEGRHLLISLLLAFIPAAVIGLVFEKPIKSHLLAVGPVVFAWIVGGVILIAIAPRIRTRSGGEGITRITPKHALVIGFAQALAMWPGTSRSLVTILAALAIGMTLSAAVEFSFLLGLLTLGAATAYEGLKNGQTMIDAYGVFTPLLGMVVAFVFAVVSIRFMVTWLRTRSLAVFGWERIVVAAISIALLIAGTI